MNDYYVYIYWRLDTNEPFYVGKGKDKRWKDLRKRCKHFNNIINKYPITVEIVKDNLTEDEALGIECWLINELVFECGFSIDIKGANSNDHYCHLVNQTWGGEGTSGMNPFENKTEEEIQEWRRKVNENNGRGMYGRHHTEESRRKISENRKEKCKNPEFKKMLSKLNFGENNPMYGRSGKDSPNAKSVICLTTKRIFFTAKEGAECYNCQSSHIGKCCRGEKYYKSVGKLEDGTRLVWRFLVWNHNKKYRIKK